MAEIAKLYASIGADASGLNKALSSAKSDLNVAAKGFSQFESVVSTGFKAIAVAGAAVFAGVAAGMTKAISAAASLEQQAANTAAVFGSMAPPVKEVKDLISELGLNPQLLVSMEQAGDAVNMLAKNGVAWESILGGVAEKTILLANATGSDFSLSADAATDAMAIFNLGVEDMDRVVSSAVAMVTNSKFDMQDFAYVLANLAPTAATMGLSLEEMSAVVTMTASSFKSGRTAATSWSLLLSNLVPQSESAADAMKELGLMTEEGKNIFFDANGDLKKMGDLLGILQSTFGGLTAEQQINYSRTIFGREAYGALAAVLQLNTAELGAMTEKMGDMDAVIEGAKTRTNTFSAAWALLSDTLTAVMAQIGDQFLPLFSDLARDLAQFVADNAPAVVEWFGKIAAELEDVIEWVRAWITTGDMFNEKWDEVSPRIQGVVLAVKGFIDIIGHTVRAIGEFVGQFVTWQDVWTAFGLLLGVTLVKAIAGFVIAISPLLLVIGSAIAAVAALRLAWENDWLGLRTTFEPIVNFILAGFRSLSEAFWLFVADGKITSEEFSRLWEIAAVYVGGALTLMWGHVRTAFTNIATEITTFATVLDQNIREMTGGLLALQDIIIGLAAVIVGPLVKAFVVSAVGAISAFLAAAAPFLGWIAAAIAAAAALRLAWENDWMGIRTAFEPVIGVIQRGFGLLKTLYDDFRADGKITGEEWGKLWDAAQIVFARALGAIWKATKEVLGNVWNEIVDFGKKAWDEFGVKFPKTADALERAFEGAQTVIGRVLDFFDVRTKATGQAIKDFAADAKREIDAWAAGQKTAFEATAAIWQSARDTFSVVMGDMKTIAADAGGAIYAEFAVRFPLAAGAMTTAVGTVSAAWKEFAATFKLYVDEIKAVLTDLWSANTAASLGITGDWGWGVEELERLFAIMATVFSTTITTILQTIKAGMQIAIGDWTGAWDTMKGIVQTALSATAEVAKQALGILLGYFGVAVGDVLVEVNKMIAHGRAFITNFTDAAKQAWAQLKGEFTSLIVGPIQALVGDMLTYGRNLAQGFWDGVRQRWTEFTSWWSGALDNLRQRLHAWGIFGSPSRLFEQYGTWLGQGFQSGITGSIPGVLGAMDNLAGNVMSRANSLTASLGAQATEWNRILGNIAHANSGTGTGGATYTPANDPVTQGMIDAGLDIATGHNFDIMAGVANLAAWGRTFAQDVANYAGSLAYDVAADAGLVGANYRGAVTTLTDNVEDTEAQLIQALYTLVNAIRAAPTGNQFNISTAAAQTGNAYTDLSSLVQYLNAQYAS